MRLSRPLAALCTIAPLVLTATACSDSSGGQIQGTNGPGFSQIINNPVQGKCIRFDPRGVTDVTNTTGVDIVLHLGPDCTDPPNQASSYLPTTVSITNVPGQGPWHSFKTVGWTPPVPAH
jgi:hypothetical protein